MTIFGIVSAQSLKQGILEEMGSSMQIKKHSFLLSILLFSVSMGISFTSYSQSMSPEEKAKKLFERLTGTKIASDNPVLAQMAQMIQSNNYRGAAQLATQNPNFLNLTVRQMATKISTRELSIFSPFNDFAASFMGVTRDQSDARELLYGNFYYMGDPARLTGQNIPSNIQTDLVLSNNHYEALNNRVLDIGSVLMRVNGQQIAQPGANNTFTLVANPDPAGILTSRAFLGAHASGGTNRRLVEYTFKAFMCLNMTEIADSNASDARIGRDIDRFPGGDHNQFQNTCKACHTVMDGFRGAFAAHDFIQNRVQLGSVTPFQCTTGQSSVACKMNNPGNIAFPQGYITTNTSWVNHSLRQDGKNLALLGFRTTGGTNIIGGNGVQSFGRMIAESERFSQCMSQKVYEAVCRQKIDWSTNINMLKEFAQGFETSRYNLKSLFETIAIDPRCSG